MKCPHCNGNGTVNAVIDGIRGGKRFGERRILPCPTCDGTGEVDGFRAERVALGEEIRKARIAGEYVKPREMADRLGIDVVYLSHAEAGRVGLDDLRTLAARVREIKGEEPPTDEPGPVPEAEDAG